jgi:hypothetical protein
MAVLPDNIAEKASAVLQQLNSSVRNIKDDKRLTPEAKKTDLARAYVRARNDMEAVKAELAKQEAAHVDKLTRRVFGNSPTTGSDIIAARDADDRAARLENAEEAQRALARAEKNNDASLARAIALRAYEEARTPFGGSGWGEVLSGYSGSRPGVSEDVAELARITTSSFQQDFMRGIQLHVMKPGELERYGDQQIDAIAASE